MYARNVFTVMNRINFREPGKSFICYGFASCQLFGVFRESEQGDSQGIAF